MTKKWLKIEDIDIGTKIRTVISFIIGVVGAYYTHQGLLNDLLNQLGWGKAAMIIALVAAALFIIGEGYTTFMNNDYSEEASVGTDVGRKLASDPTLVVVETIDGDADEEDEEDEDDPGEYDEIIEEGE